MTLDHVPELLQLPGNAGQLSVTANVVHRVHELSLPFNLRVPGL
jgi:hypothetical protein